MSRYWIVLILILLFHQFEIISSTTYKIGVIRNVSFEISNTQSSIINGTCNECLCKMLLNKTSIYGFNCFKTNTTCELFSTTLKSRSFWLINNSMSLFYFFPFLIDDIVSNITATTDSTVPCAPQYSRAPSGLCVNLQIDFNNCGSFGHVCSSNYTSCSAGACSSAPPVQLVGGTSIPGFGGNFSNDDTYTTLNLPMALTLYNYSTTTVSVSTNGVVCLRNCSASYINGNLPTTSFAGPTAFGYWDDLMIYANTFQSIYYNVAGTAPNRTTTFEFYEAHYGQPYLYYRFQIIFYENLPNTVKYVYFQSSDGGSSATIGVQASSTGPAITYSVNQPNSVTSNMTLIFNTYTGTYIG